MYCPNCGKTNSADQRFCRSCGLSLEKVVQSLSEQLSAADLDKNILDRQHKLERWINIIAGSTISILVGGVLWGVIYEIIIVKGEVLEGSVFLVFIIGLILFTLLVVYRETLMKTSGKRRETQPALRQEGAAIKLPPDTNPEPVSSVTEDTTELLAAKENGSKK